QEVAGCEVDARDRGELDAVQEIPSRQPTRASVSPAWGQRTALCEQREAAGLEDAQLAYDPVPTPVRAGSAGADPPRVALDAPRVGELERLRRRVERVRHGNVDARGAVGFRARTLAAADRLVVREAVRAEHDVVHRALALREHRQRLSEGGEHDVG